MMRMAAIGFPARDPEEREDHGAAAAAASALPSAVTGGD